VATASDAELAGDVGKLLPGPTGRVVRVLDYLANNAGQAYTLTQLATALGMSKATLHQIVQVLVKARYLTRNQSTLSYGLGAALIGIGIAAQGNLQPALDLARPLMTEVSLRHGEAAVSALLDGEIVVLARSSRGTTIPPGGRERTMPYAPPVGAVFAAWAAPADVEGWLAQATEPAWDERRVTQLRQALDAVRGRGYSVATAVDPRQRLRDFLDHQPSHPEHDVDMRAEIAAMLRDMDEEQYLLTEPEPGRDYAVDHIAAPVLGPDGKVLIAITVTGLSRRRLTAHDIGHIGDELRAATTALSAQLNT
jgi:DNA-binding IclR family transcriptional regulator